MEKNKNKRKSEYPTTIGQYKRCNIYTTRIPEEEKTTEEIFEIIMPEILKTNDRHQPQIQEAQKTSRRKIQNTHTPLEISYLNSRKSKMKAKSLKDAEGRKVEKSIT